jgi:hypothetical protein
VNDVEKLILAEVRGCRKEVAELSSTLVAHMAAEEVTTDDIDRRLSKLETWKSKALLGAGALGGAAAVAAQLLGF